MLLCKCYHTVFAEWSKKEKQYIKFLLSDLLRSASHRCHEYTSINLSQFAQLPVAVVLHAVENFDRMLLSSSSLFLLKKVAMKTHPIIHPKKNIPRQDDLNDFMVSYLNGSQLYNVSILLSIKSFCFLARVTSKALDKLS